MAVLALESAHTKIILCIACEKIVIHICFLAKQIWGEQNAFEYKNVSIFEFGIQNYD